MPLLVLRDGVKDVLAISGEVDELLDLLNIQIAPRRDYQIAVIPQGSRVDQAIP